MAAGPVRKNPGRECCEGDSATPDLGGENNWLLVPRRKRVGLHLWGSKREWILQVVGNRVKQLRGLATSAEKVSHLGTAVHNAEQRAFDILHNLCIRTRS